MADNLITYELDGPLALIGLNRAEKRNAINDELVEQLRAAVRRVRSQVDRLQPALTTAPARSAKPAARPSRNRR